MPTTNQRTYNSYSMSSQSRSKAYGALNILWKKMRPDLHFEDKETVREERLVWIANLLGLKKLDSTKTLTDKQIGLVLAEMKHLTGETPKTPQITPKPPPSAIVGIVETGADNVVYLSAERASDEQIYTLRKLLEFLDWSEEYQTEFLTKRGFPADISALRFKKAHPLMMLLLNSAAHKDLKAQGKQTGRKETAKHIPIIKRKLQIDR